MPEDIAADEGGLIAGAERVLAEAWGGPVTLAPTDVLRDKYRNRVRRLAVQNGPTGTPQTVIVKASVPPEGEAFAPEDDGMGGATWRFLNEWAGTRFLDGIDADPPLCARLYGGDAALGLIVLEDLGPPLSLADRMQTEGRTALEAALFAYARSLGRLHARTVGREAEFTALRRSLGGREGEREPEGVRWLRENVEPLTKLCARLEVPLPDGFDAEIESVRQTFDTPGAFWAFSPGDTCPDNHRLPDGDDGYLRFFDFEFAGFRHALLDAAYLVMPFPSCWCVNRLPHELASEMIEAYRAELARGSEAAGSPDFGRQLTFAAAYWLAATLSWGSEKVLDEDQKWGISTVRQRHLMRLDNFLWAQSAYSPDALPAFAQLARRLSETLRARWQSDLEEMPLYPALRDKLTP